MVSWISTLRRERKDGVAGRAEDDPRLALGDVPEVAFGAGWYRGNMGGHA